MASDVTIRIRDNGPLIVEGVVHLLDGEGREYVRDPAKPAVALCRCAQSKNLPFCDGAHKTCDFQSCARAST
jgi:CDGSH-type Zn-finger protein